MNTISQQRFSKTRVWAGSILTAIVTLILLGSSIAKIAGVPEMVNGLTRAGIPRGGIVSIAVLELTCLALYLMQRTKVLGMVLLTGYFGGATVTHIIGHENFFPPLLIGLWIWAGAYLRVPELASLVPLRKNQAQSGASQRADGMPTLSRVKEEKI